MAALRPHTQTLTPLSKQAKFTSISISLCKVTSLVDLPIRQALKSQIHHLLSHSSHTTISLEVQAPSVEGSILWLCSSLWMILRSLSLLGTSRREATSKVLKWMVLSSRVTIIKQIKNRAPSWSKTISTRTIKAAILETLKARIRLRHSTRQLTDITTVISTSEMKTSLVLKVKTTECTSILSISCEKRQETRDHLFIQNVSSRATKRTTKKDSLTKKS